MTAVAVEAASAPEAPPTRRETVTRLLGLVVGTAAVTTLIDVLGGWAWIVVVYAVIAIIMLHELGHYVTARLCGMKATEFFVGFGPKLWSFRRGETEYGVKALPLGGYVRILGMTSIEELDPSDEPRSFVNQPTRQRVLVASAGSIVHVLLAIVLAFCALFFIGRPLSGPYPVKIMGLVHVSGVVTPAQRAGLLAGDVVVSIGGTKANSDNVVTLILSADGKDLRMVVERGHQLLTVTARPRILRGFSYPPGVKKYPVLGVDLEGIPQTAHPGLVGSITTSGWFTWKVTTATVAAFGHAFSLSGLSSLFHEVTNAKAGQSASSASQPHSIFGALSIAVDAARAGVLPLLEVLISLNISLGILNMLPMLPLDGGHVAIAVYERARTRRGKPRYRADVNKLVPYAYVFMAFLLVFVASKAYLDFAHGISNPFG